jgi:uncharacterized membrane protein
MTTTLIIVARLMHIVSSTIWAGFVIIAGFVLVSAPRNEKPEETRRIRQSAISRAARVVAPAAVVSLLSGLFLFSALHSGGRSPTEMVLGIGALSAVLSFLVGALGSARPERPLEKLDALGEARSSADMAKIRALNGRVIASARVTAALLLISAAAMAVARFLY